MEGFEEDGETGRKLEAALEAELGLEPNQIESIWIAGKTVSLSGKRIVLTVLVELE